MEARKDRDDSRGFYNTLLIITSAVATDEEKYKYSKKRREGEKEIIRTARISGNQAK